MRFNQTTKGSNTTTNYEGAKAYKLSPELELYTLVCTASLQRNFYTGPEDTISRLRKLLRKVEPEFAIKLAVYAREQMYLRSIPLVMAVEFCAAFDNKTELVQRCITRVIQRADELSEILAYFQEAHEREGPKKLKRLPNVLKKGIAHAFDKFDEYQFAKYNRDSEVKIRDAMFLCHPKPSTDKQELYKKIANNTLSIPYTWETELSKQDGRSKKEKWEALVSNRKLGYMASLRNLRNMLNENIDNIQEVLSYISDPVAVSRSKQLPFRFLAAYKELQDVANFKTSSVLEALEAAIKTSTCNIEGFDDNTNVVIACDLSGSMDMPVSPRSSIKYYEIGLVLGMLLQNVCSSVLTGIFGCRWKVIQLPRHDILANTHKLAKMQEEGIVGYSTNGHLAIKHLLVNNLRADKVMIFTDCQLWDSTSFYYADESSAFIIAWAEYKRMFPNAKLYMFDLSGYGNTPIDMSTKDVYLISGWSDKVFNILAAVERGESALAQINNIVV